MSNIDVLSAFNNHLTELFEALIEMFPNDHTIKLANTAILTLRKANPKIVLPIWKTYILDKYEENIMLGNLNYFLEKDWTTDFVEESSVKLVLEKITIVKQTIKNLSDDDLQKTILYLQNLTKLCKLYYINKANKGNKANKANKK
jgi:hypothetical protein